MDNEPSGINSGAHNSPLAPEIRGVLVQANIQKLKGNFPGNPGMNPDEFFSAAISLVELGGTGNKREFIASRNALRKADNDTKRRIGKRVNEEISEANTSGDEELLRLIYLATKELGIKESIPELKALLDYLESKFKINTRRSFLKRSARLGVGLVGLGLLPSAVWSASQMKNSPRVFGSPSPSATVEIKPPTLEPTKEPIKTPEKPVNLIEKFLQPFVVEALKRRRYWKENDPEFLKRVDQELNTDRLNILLFGYGEEHQDTYADYGGSISMLSYDLKTGQISSISLSRDIRCPELELLLPEGQKRPMPIRYVYRDGKFDLMRKVAERATGLSADFQIVLKDTVIRDFIQEVGGDLMINVEKPHQAGKYRLGGQEFPSGFIPQGEQIMDVSHAMQFILAEDEKPDGKKDERSYRKNILIRAIKQKLSDKIKSNFLQAATLPFQIKDFISKRVFDKDIILDFDMDIFSKSLGGVANVIKEFATNMGRSSIILPEENISREASVHDPFWGDGSVTRVHNIRNSSSIKQNSPRITAEAKNGFMPDWMLIPDGGDPYSDNLIDNYWKAVRNLVKTTITK